MQIPYDLEFVENRPTVRVKAAAFSVARPFPAHARRPDVFDRFLAWAFRIIRRIETK